VKVLFYSPFANIWEHSFPEALVGESFARHDVDVVTVRCGTMLQVHCVAMSAASVGPDASLATREQVCRACIKRRDLISSEMGLPALIIDEWVNESDRSQVEALLEEIAPDTWTELRIDGIPLGRYAAYEMWLGMKLVDTDLSAEVWIHYLGQLRNTLLTYLAAKRILDVEKPNSVIVYNDHYSVNHAFCAAAERAGISTYTLHGGSHMVRRTETLSLFRSNHTMDDIFRSAAWKHYRQSPIGSAEVDLVGEHFSGLLEASSAFVYSSAFKGTSPGELRQTLGVADGRRVLLATMSSEDELFAMRLIDAVPTARKKASLFADQLKWVEFLLEYARTNPEIHLVVRLHPRMFPNKRENVLSIVVGKVMALRETAPANVTFNLPSDDIGLYDLMQIVDALLNFHSTVGAELAVFGIPVVVPINSDFYTYPDEINRIARSHEEYVSSIAQVLEEGWSIENSRKAFRWFAFLFSRMSVDLSDAVSSRPIAIRPRKPGRRLWLWKKLVYVFLQYGPLLRERLALRKRTISDASQTILLDVVLSELNGTSESTLWPSPASNVETETKMIEGYLLQLSATLWRDIDAPNSLAGRIRAHLGVTAGTADPA
jgi:hypothetical protein